MKTLTTRHARRGRVLAVLGAVALIAGACGGDDGGSSSDTSPADTGSASTEAPDSTEGGSGSADFTVGIALGAPKNDQAYFQSVFEGASSGAEALGTTYSVVDNLTDETAAGDAIRNLSETNKLVVVDITLFGALIPVAEENPDVTYIVTSGFFAADEVPANVFGYVTVYGWPTYPMGQIAATLSKTGKLGYITGPTFPIERTALAGFTEGAKSINPDIEVVETVIDTYSDVPGAKQAAAAQISSGVDILYGFIDAGFVGLQQAADEATEDVLLFSPVVDRCDRGDNIVGNNVSDIKAMTASAVSDFANGTLPEPTKAYGLEDEAIQYFNLCPGFQDPELVDLAETTVAAIRDGSLVLPASVTAS